MANIFNCVHFQNQHIVITSMKCFKLKKKITAVLLLINLEKHTLKHLITKFEMDNLLSGFDKCEIEVV